MSFWGIVIVSILSVVAFVTFVADLRVDNGPSELSALDRVLSWFLGFFGIGGLPPMLALAVLTSTAAIAAAALDAIAILHLGAGYPSWFAANAGATGLGIGLACVRLLAVSKPRDLE